MVAHTWGSERRGSEILGYAWPNNQIVYLKKERKKVKLEINFSDMCYLVSCMQIFNSNKYYRITNDILQLFILSLHTTVFCTQHN